MDPVTHLLFGAVMGRSGANRKSGLATLTMVLAAEAPDLDVFVNFVSPVDGFAVHRGFTHTFLGAPVMAAATLAVVYGIHRVMLRCGRPPKDEVRWKWLYLFAVLASLSHIVLDFTNNYGVRPLAPFSYRWHSWDIVNILDPFVTGALLLALVAPWFLGLIGGEIGARKRAYPGRRAAILAMVFLVFYWSFRDFQHRRAVLLLENADYGDAEPVKVSANPYPFNPFHWHGVVETEAHFYAMPVDTWRGTVDRMQMAVVRAKPEETEVTLAAKKSQLGRVFLDWARHPIAETHFLSEQKGYYVYLYDLRYAYPERRNRVLGTSYWVDPQGRLLGEWVGEPPDPETLDEPAP